jgi:uncharacterized protein YbbK (DUF523 family)
VEHQDTEDRPEVRPSLVVSACLLGLSTRFDGGHKSFEAVNALARRFVLVPVCPEQLGGLPTPRTPAEVQEGESAERGTLVVRDRDGVDVSDSFQRGADAVVTIAALVGARAAVLKARSPSCGVHRTYDGTFTGRTRPGRGVAASALERAGLHLYTEEDIAEGRGPD